MCFTYSTTHHAPTLPPRRHIAPLHMEMPLLTALPTQCVCGRAEDTSTCISFCYDVTLFARQEVAFAAARVNAACACCQPAVAHARRPCSVLPETQHMVRRNISGLTMRTTCNTTLLARSYSSWRRLWYFRRIRLAPVCVRLRKIPVPAETAVVVVHLQPPYLNRFGRIATCFMPSTNG
jgi:hypothetical protein